MLRLRRRVACLVSGVAIAALVAGAPLAAATPADASDQHVGHGGYESRCDAKWYELCLYYYHGMTTGAYWGTYSDDYDLKDNKFFSNTGAGSGQVVKNNATAMACPYEDLATRCFSFYNHGFSGSYDWENDAEVGQLYYTWNNDASVMITAS